MSRLTSVDLPAPVVPTMPTMSPGSMVRLMSERVILVRSNEKLTFLNSILPRMAGQLPFPVSASSSASRMSSTRSAEDSAL